jgi:hypothetical protein
LYRYEDGIARLSFQQQQLGFGGRGGFPPKISARIWNLLCFEVDGIGKFQLTEYVTDHTPNGSLYLDRKAGADSAAFKQL